MEPTMRAPADRRIGGVGRPRIDEGRGRRPPISTFVGWPPDRSFLVWAPCR